jgi:glycosyltransferase involved in cell wall biosynthesis
LKTADILKRFTNVEFEWNIFGVNEYDFWIKKLRINSEKVNIKFKGIADALILINNLLDSDLFVHPSYIDNSPNSICEAQILGMPIISTNVGGISSLIDDGKTGLLIPSNDPYQLAAKILELNNNRDLAIKLGANARIEALKRHNKDTITENLLSIYKNVSKE